MSRSTDLPTDGQDESALAAGRAVESGEYFTPPAINETELHVNWILAYPQDSDYNVVKDDDDVRKQVVAPYMTGDARVVPWNDRLPEERYPATDYETVKKWEGMEIGRDLPEYERAATKELGHGVILPTDREEKNPKGITIIDWDDVRDPETGAIHPVALKAIREVGGYGAISQSDKGLHQWVYGELPEGRKFVRHIDDEPFVGDDRPKVEIYTTGRLVAMTGRHVAGTGRDVVEAQDTIDRLCWEFGAGTNNSTRSPSDPFAHERADGGEDGTRGTPSTDEIGEAMRTAEPGLQVDPTVGPEDADTGDLPKCYERALTARYDDSTAGEGGHNVNLLASNLGANAGYSTEEMVEHFATFVPNGDPDEFDRRKTEQSVAGTISKVEDDELEAPSVSRLRRAGLFDAGELCEDTCPIHGSGTVDRGEQLEDDENVHEAVTLLPEIDAKPGRTEGTFGTLQAQGDGVTAGEPPIKEVHGRTLALIDRAMSDGDQAVIDGIMGGGKSYGVFLAAAEKDEPITYLSARKDLYVQAREYADENGIPEDEIYVLPTPSDCDTWRGQYGDERADYLRMLYNRGVRASAMHKLLDDDQLPCQAGDRVCPFQARNQYEPDDYQVLIGHYKHAHLPQVTAARHTVIDENPTDAFRTRLGGAALKRGVNAFLDLHDSPPVDGFDDLLQARHDPERRKKALQWFATANEGEGYPFEPDERNAVRFADDGFHAYAPNAVYAILAAEPVDDTMDLYDDDESEDTPRRYEFEKAIMPDGIGNAALFYTTSKRFSMGEHDDYFVEFQTPPELQYARSMLALDGTPMTDTWSNPNGPNHGNVVEWELALGRPLKHRRVLTDDERASFLATTMGHTYIQTTKHARPYSSGYYTRPERDAALLAAGSRRYLAGEPWDVVLTSKTVGDEYRERGFTEPERGLAKRIDHRGNIRGSDEYAHCASGVILGSAHHGDHHIARRAAWLDAQIRPEGKGMDRTYGPVGDAVLHQMRELATAQTALRIGRGPTGRGALVLIDTAAVPEWIPVINRESPGEVKLWSKGERKVRDAVHRIAANTELDDGEELMLRSSEIKEHVDGIGARQIRNVLKKHADRDLLRKKNDPEDGRRNVWGDTGLSTMIPDESATVGLPPADTDDERAGRIKVRVPEKSHIVSYMENFRVSVSASVRSSLEIETDGGVETPALINSVAPTEHSSSDSRD